MPRHQEHRRRSRITSRGRALVLAMQGQYAEAARLLLSQLPIPLSAGSARDRREASVAATYLEKAGRPDAAARLFAILGAREEPPRSLPIRRPPAEPELVAVPPLELLAADPPVPSPRGTVKAQVPEPRAPSPPRRPQRPAPSAARRAPYAPGEVIAQRFRLEAELGRGGMAVVYRARDLELEEPVAIKVFSQSVRGTRGEHEGLQRFRQELKLARRLVHPNIVRVYDIGVDAGRRYITMELLDGVTLLELMGEPVDLSLSLAVLVKACEGLAAAHAQGVVHRDVKPENLFVTRDGGVKVMDFGIAKSARVRGPTVAGTTAGTPEYIAPEQISEFSAVGPAADQYSLGVVAYELLTGRLPFYHQELLPLFFMHLEKEPPSLREVVPAIPGPVEAAVLRMLAKAPEKRHPSCEQLARVFTRLRDQLC